MELWRYYRKLYRRKWLIIIGMVVCVGVATTMALMQRTTFTAVTRVMERSPSFQGQNVLPEAMFTAADPELRLANLARIASSRTVLLRVLDELRFDSGIASKVYSFEIQEWLQKVDVLPERDTQLLRISVTDADSGVAIRAADVVAQEFGDYYRELIYGAETQKEYIEVECEKARKQAERTRTALAAYKKQRKLSDLAYDTQAKIQRLSDLESQLRAALVMKSETAKRATSTARELNQIPRQRDESVTRGENQLWNTLTANLKDQEMKLASMMAHRGTNHPEVQALQQSIADARNNLADEQRERVVQQVRVVNPVYSSTYDRYIQAKVESIGANARHGALTRVVPALKAELADYPENERRLSELTLEARVADETYGLLRQKLNEAKIRESEPFATGTIKQVDAAALDRVSGGKKLKVMLALPLSILLSCLVIFILDYLDNTIRTPEEAEELLGLPVAAMVPIGRGHSLVRGKADLGLRESYQMLSANLWHNRVQEGGNGGILVASAEPNSGRTVTAGNLAASLAADGARVILVDADLRQPAQHLVFGVENAKGFSNVLAGAAALEDVAVPTRIEGLLLVPSGPLPDNPMKLLRGDTMKKFLEDTIEVADFVVFDSPAGSAFADATVLASYIQRVLLVQSAGRVPRGAEREFKSRLEQVGAEFIGVVLNKVRPDDSHGLYHFRTAYAGLPQGGPPPGTVSPTSPAIPG